MAAVANVGAGLPEMREKARQAEERSQQAFEAMKNAAQDIAEVNLQTSLQAGLMIAEDALKTSILGTSGPLGLPVVLALSVVFGMVDDKIDEKLGTEPLDLTNGLDSVAGELSTNAGRVTTVLEVVKPIKDHAKDIGGKLAAFDKARLVFEGIEEGTAATKAFVESSTDFAKAQHELHGVCSEAEALYNERIPKLLETLAEIPGMVEEAKADAEAAASTIAELEGCFGDELYAPPVR